MYVLFAMVAVFIVVVLSYLADRKYPEYRIYIIPTGIVLMCAIALYSSWHAPMRPSTLSEEQRISILTEQPYFITWYNNYKENISQLDRFASVYHKILDNYENKTITAEKALSQLQKLHEETDKFNQSLKDQLPPSELSQNNYIIVYNILEKTRIYSYKLNETTRQSIIILNEGIYNKNEHKDIVNNLNRIYAIEAPVILDISSEVAQIKSNLTIPENT